MCNGSHEVHVFLPLFAHFSMEAVSHLNGVDDIVVGPERAVVDQNDLLAVGSISFCFVDINEQFVRLSINLKVVPLNVLLEALLNNMLSSYICTNNN